MRRVLARSAADARRTSAVAAALLNWDLGAFKIQYIEARFRASSRASSSQVNRIKVLCC
jgi:hypothetical protein